MYHYVRTGVLPNYLKNETYFDEDDPLISSAQVKATSASANANSKSKCCSLKHHKAPENEENKLKMKSHISANNNISMLNLSYHGASKKSNVKGCSSSSKKKQLLDTSISTTINTKKNVLSTTKKKVEETAPNKELDVDTASFSYEYASLFQSRTLPPPPPKFKPILSKEAQVNDLNYSKNLEKNLTYTMDKIILAAKNLNNSFTLSKCHRRHSRERENRVVDDKELRRSRTKIDLNISLPAAVMNHAYNLSNSNSGGCVNASFSNGVVIGGGGGNGEASCESFLAKRYYSSSKKHLPYDASFNETMNSNVGGDIDIKKKYIFTSIQDLNKYF